MPRLRLSSLLALSALLALLWPAAAHADGIIVDPHPPCRMSEPCPPGPRALFPLAVQNHRVTVNIDKQVATTHVDEIFRNDNAYAVEGTYIFPIPADAAVSDFAMWVDGQRVDAKVLTTDEARRVYDDIVRQARDPALLEYAGRGAVQASLFPVPSGATRHVELTYSQVLLAEAGLVHYKYPLNTEKFSAQPLEQVSVAVQVVSAQAIRAIYSPTHDIAVVRSDDFNFTAGYEANHVTPNTDFDLYYSVASDDVGLNLLTYRDPASGEGFFVLLAAPSLAANAGQVVAKDVIMVLDQSGSMEGEKFAQAQGALDYVLGHLNPDDRFNITAFSTGARDFAQSPQPASQASAASRWVHEQHAGGGTDINLALSEALSGVERGSTRPVIVIFVTDGLATEGVVDTSRILNNVAQAAPQNVRLFAFGVGDDVDTFLLDSLAEQNHGASSYVRPGQRLDEAVSGFYARVSTPVLSNIKLDFGGVAVTDLYPTPLPDLFAGSQLVVTGRYSGSGAGTITLSGLVNGETRTFAYPDQSFSSLSGGNEFIPRLWATRSIGHLLNEIRLHGENQELIDSVVKLSVRYGIVTPYTSYLVTESGTSVLTDAGRSALAANQYAAAQGTQPLTSGADAVAQSQAQSALSAAAAPASVQGEAANVVRIVGSRTFLLRDGVWIDTGFDPSRLKAVPVTFASDAYFALLYARPELSLPFALGPRVIALAGDGTAYQVTLADTPALNVPPTYTPGPRAQNTPVAPITPVARVTNATPITPVAPVTNAVPISRVAPASAAAVPHSSVCGASVLPAIIALSFIFSRKRRRATSRSDTSQ